MADFCEGVANLAISSISLDNAGSVTIELGAFSAHGACVCEKHQVRRRIA